MLHNRKILLVEDNPDQAEIYCTELENTGFKVFSTADSTEALAIIEREEPRLVLLDLMLGNSSGLDLLEKIKESTTARKVKVVAITNFREKELLESQRLKGIYDYIYKPDFTPREIAQKVQGYLEA